MDIHFLLLTYLRVGPKVKLGQIRVKKVISRVHRFILLILVVENSKTAAAIAKYSAENFNIPKGGNSI